MKKILILLALALPLAGMAQRKITSTRLEVTARLDQAPCPQALRTVAPYRAAVDSVMAPVLGRSLTGMTAGRPESLLGNWVADAMVEFSNFDGGPRADLSIMNVGGLRNNMPLGEVRRGDILLISPFENILVVATLRGSDLLDLMRNVAATKGEAVSREVRLEITPDGQLLKATVGGQPIDPERLYRVATQDYLAEGNDKMHAFRKAVEVKSSGQYTRDVMMRCVQRAGTISSRLEGRIIIKQP